MGTATDINTLCRYKLLVEAHSKIDGDCDNADLEHQEPTHELKRIPKLMGTATVPIIRQIRSNKLKRIPKLMGTATLPELFSNLPAVEAHSKIDGDCDVLPKLAKGS